MAHFCGFVKGRARTETTRVGSKDSGLTTVAASWEGAVRVSLYAGPNEQDYAVVSLIPWEGRGVTRILYDGPVSGKRKRRTKKGLK